MFAKLSVRLSASNLAAALFTMPVLAEKTGQLVNIDGMDAREAEQALKPNSSKVINLVNVGKSCSGTSTISSMRGTHPCLPVTATDGCVYDNSLVGKYPITGEANSCARLHALPNFPSRRGAWASSARA